jgi:NAD(P)-dependent dehydrogenase (short-subunit alcohol dehydrogenase family)
VPLELADELAVDAAWAAAERGSGGIDLLVNNAGSAMFGAIAGLTPDQWNAQMAVLLHGPVRLARQAWAAMRERGRGTIVNVTSLAVELPIPFLDAYNTAKAGLAAFTATLRDEAEGGPVVVVDFRPGDFRTNFTTAMRSRQSAPAVAPSRESRVWARLEALTATAPPPARAARDLERVLRRPRSGVIRSGGFFQVRVAPWGNRLLPERFMRLLRARYFRIGS